MVFSGSVLVWNVSPSVMQTTLRFEFRLVEPLHEGYGDVQG